MDTNQPFHNPISLLISDTLPNHNILLSLLLLAHGALLLDLLGRLVGVDCLRILLLQFDFVDADGPSLGVKVREVGGAIWCGVRTVVVRLQVEVNRREHLEELTARERT